VGSARSALKAVQRHLVLRQVVPSSGVDAGPEVEGARYLDVFFRRPCGTLWRYCVGDGTAYIDVRIAGETIFSLAH
jgi:hypothetical protein